MNQPTRFYRHQEIQKIRGDLERESFPRLQMALLVALTGTAGFVSSFLLLHAGMSTMWIRYLMALGIAYIAFLLLLWLWLRTRADDYDCGDALDLADMLPSPSGPGPSAPGYSGKGGQFDGGGASGNFDSPLGDAAFGGDGKVIGKALDGVGDADELAIPLVVLVLIGTLIVTLIASSFFMIYSAPILFAELLVDGVLSASLYRRLRGLRTRHWLDTALRRTAGPFALTAVIVAATGWAMAVYAPGAHSIGDVVFQSRQGK